MLLLRSGDKVSIVFSYFKESAASRTVKTGCHISLPWLCLQACYDKAFMTRYAQQLYSIGITGRSSGKADEYVGPMRKESKKLSGCRCPAEAALPTRHEMSVYVDVVSGGRSQASPTRTELESNKSQLESSGYAFLHSWSEQVLFWTYLKEV